MIILLEVPDTDQYIHKITDVFFSSPTSVNKTKYFLQLFLKLVETLEICSEKKL